MITREDWIKIGEITKTHGLQGNVVVVTESDLLEKYADEPVFILLDGAPVPFFIADEGLVARNQASYIVKFDYVDSLQQAERLTGNDLMIEKSLLDEEEIDAFDYDIFELNGFAVKEENTGQTGEVAGIADYSGNVVLTLQLSGKEILLPLTEIYVKEVDFESRTLLVDIPPEMMDLN